MATPVQETIERVHAIEVDKYKYGFFTDIESVKAPKGPDRRHRALYLRKKARA